MIIENIIIFKIPFNVIDLKGMKLLCKTIDFLGCLIVDNVII